MIRAFPLGDTHRVLRALAARHPEPLTAQGCEHSRVVVGGVAADASNFRAAFGPRNGPNGPTEYAMCAARWEALRRLEVMEAMWLPTLPLDSRLRRVLSAELVMSAEAAKLAGQEIIWFVRRGPDDYQLICEAAENLAITYGISTGWPAWLGRAEGHSDSPAAEAIRRRFLEAAC